MKIVTFNDSRFECPDWAKYITMDDYGRVEVWNNPPHKRGMIYIPVYVASSKTEVVGRLRQMDSYQEIA